MFQTLAFYSDFENAKNIHAPSILNGALEGTSGSWRSRYLDHALDMLTTLL